MMLMEFWSDQWKADVRGAIHRLCVQVHMLASPSCFAPKPVLQTVLERPRRTLAR